MNDATIISRMDALVDTYGTGQYDINALLDMRRELAVLLYALTAQVRSAYGNAAVSYARRKYAIAKEVVAARSVDAKAAMSLTEARAETLLTSQQHREAEAWAEAEKEALRSKIDMGKQVLAAMQQEIAHLAYEQKTTHYQGTST